MQIFKLIFNLHLTIMEDLTKGQFAPLKAATNDEYLLTKTVAENLFDISCSQVLMVDARLCCA